MLSFLLLLSSWAVKIAIWVFERMFHHPYSRMIWKFHFGDRHLGFQAVVDIARYRKWHRWKACPRKYGDSRWNFVAMCSRTRDTPGGILPPSCQRTSQKSWQGLNNVRAVNVTLVNWSAVDVEMHVATLGEWTHVMVMPTSNTATCLNMPTSCRSLHRGCTWRKKHFPLNNLPPKMAAAFQGLITNAGLMAAGMSYSYCLLYTSPSPRD